MCHCEWIVANGSSNSFVGASSPQWGSGGFAKASRKSGGLGFWASQPSPEGLGLELSPGLASGLTQWFSTQERVPSRGLGTLRDSFGCYNLGGAIGIYWIDGSSCPEQGGEGVCQKHAGRGS